MDFNASLRTLVRAQAHMPALASLAGTVRVGEHSGDMQFAWKLTVDGMDIDVRAAASGRGERSLRHTAHAVARVLRRERQPALRVWLRRRPLFLGFDAAPRLTRRRCRLAAAQYNGVKMPSALKSTTGCVTVEARHAARARATAVRCLFQTNMLLRACRLQDVAFLRGGTTFLKDLDEGTRTVRPATLCARLPRRRCMRLGSPSGSHLHTFLGGVFPQALVSHDVRGLNFTCVTLRGLVGEQARALERLG